MKLTKSQLKQIIKEELEKQFRNEETISDDEETAADDEGRIADLGDKALDTMIRNLNDSIHRSGGVLTPDHYMELLRQVALVLWKKQIHQGNWQETWAGKVGGFENALRKKLPQLGREVGDPLEEKKDK